MSIDQKVSLILVALFLVIYVPITYIMLRNVTFHALLKYVFCFSVVPIFAVLLVVSIWFTNEYLPWLAALHDPAREYGGVRGEAIWAFASLIPIPALGSWLWYVLIRLLNNTLCK
jgi:hypothetical protein